MKNQNDPFCLSFSSYATDNNLVNVAIKVTHEQHQHQYYPSPLHVNAADDHFEFVPILPDSVVSTEETTSAKRDFPADHAFPLFNRDLLSLDVKNCRQNRAAVSSGKMSPAAAISPGRRSLKKLFVDNHRDNDASSSTSEEDEELERIEPATYCVWSPLKSPDRCKKSNSTGNSSKRWKFLRHLLKRSHSDGGKDSYELVRSSSKSTPDHRLNSNLKVKAKVSSSTPSPSHRAFNRTAAATEVDKKKIKSYLPYRTFLGSFPTF